MCSKIQVQNTERNKYEDFLYTVVFCFHLFFLEGGGGGSETEIVTLVASLFWEYVKMI